ncbi:hypothetical protein SAMN05421692_3471 [Chryseobacterium indologenes]|nr:hypothetical protein SAMN05421692_3471 [Chryseobacterium indologenes]SUX51415.1 Uncharacterised protein [Chryseobacterium indologenes]
MSIGLFSYTHCGFTDVLHFIFSMGIPPLGKGVNGVVYGAILCCSTVCGPPGRAYNHLPKGLQAFIQVYKGIV